MPRPSSNLPYSIEGAVNWTGEPRQAREREGRPGRWYTDAQISHPQSSGRVVQVDVRFFGTPDGPLAVVKGDQGFGSGSVILDRDQDGSVRGMQVFLYEWHSIGSPSKPNGVLNEAQRTAAAAGRR